MAEYIHSQHFTIDEARRKLPGLMHFVEEIVELKKKLDERAYDIYRHEYFGGRGPNGDRVFPCELERLVEIIQYLTNEGILVKDLDRGLIDFPSIMSNGEEVYLCWKIGENTIEFWHTISDGFAGRKPIS
jgi:hypothetical protein